jgi:hypothetical protein
MERFVTRHQDRIAGILTGFDRMRFRGTLRSISYAQGVDKWLGAQHVLLKDFGRWAEACSAQLVAHAKAVAETAGCPYEFLPSWRISKEDRARALLAQRPRQTPGLIGVFGCVESCQSFTVRGDRATKRLRIVPLERRCTHLYFYYWDHDFGLMHIRLETWLPFTIQVCVNGREWLAQQLRRTGVAFRQVDNCVYEIADLAVAQRLLSQLDTRIWPRLLRIFGARVNPFLRTWHLRPYYWSLEESEYASDVLFRSPAALQAIYPALVEHATRQFRSPDVLRFLGRRHAAHSTGEVLTHVRQRVEGVRVKHWVEGNSLKMYDKNGHVLRIETTLNQPRRFKVYRATARGSARHWVPLRKGVADLPRRVDLSRAANARYLDALSVVGMPRPIAQILDAVSHRRHTGTHAMRPLHPIAPEESGCLAGLAEAHGLLDGIRARDLRHILSPHEPADPPAQRRLTGRVSRLLRLYRGHGLIAKNTKTHRYRLTRKGHEVITAALACRRATLEQLAA